MAQGTRQVEGRVERLRRQGDVRVLVEDLGFFGGLGTDPNNMVPLALLVAAAFLAMTRLPAPKPAASPAPAPSPATGAGRRISIALGTARASVVIALWAAVVMILGAAPLAVAET